jgi:hypothetical protein
MLAARTRRRGVGRDIMCPVDLIYRPHTHQLNAEIQVQEQRRVPIPSPGDRPRGSGRRRNPATARQGERAGPWRGHDPCTPPGLG